MTNLTERQPSETPAGVWHTYDSRRGFKITAYHLLQDREGYLWIGAFPPGGLCRYDGVAFTYYTIQDGLPGQQLEFLYQDSRGRLWIGSHDPGSKTGLVYYENGTFTPVAIPELHPHIRDMAEDADGVLWFSAFDGNIYSYDGKQATRYRTSEDKAWGIRMSVFCDSRNRVWFGGEEILCYADGAFTLYEADVSGLQSVMTITEDANGNLFFGGRGGVCRFDGGSFSLYASGTHIPQEDVTGLCTDSKNRLWIGGLNGGVTCISGEEITTFTHQDGLYDDLVYDVLLDNEGSLWFAHASGGLSRFEPDAIHKLCDDPIPHYGFTRDAQGRTWFGSNDRLGCIEDHTIRRQTLPYTFSDVLTDSSGGIWCASSLNGIYHFPSYEAVFSEDPEYIQTDQDGKVIAVMCIIEDINGDILAGGYQGLYRWDGEVFKKELSEPINIFYAYQDRNGTYWMTRWRQPGLIRYDGETVHTYTQADGLPSDYIRWITESRDGRLWIATIGGGVCCLSLSDDTTSSKPLFESFPFNEEFSNIWITRTFEDDQGRWWFSTLTDGVYCYDGRNIQSLDRMDGLPSSNIVGIVQDNDGSMLIGTQNGVVRYRIRQDNPPPIFIREVIADHVYSGDTDIELTTISASHVIFHFRGISFRTNRIRYTYRLEGYDTEWKSTWDEEAVYENLPTGDYRFQVLAIDRDLTYSTIPAAVLLSVRSDPRDEHIAVLQSEVAQLRHEVGSKYEFDHIIGKSSPMRQLFGLMEKAIDAGLTVLITGETGTGKELVAKAIHYHSIRRNKPLQELNCGAVPKELIAATLFGYRKGAFTGAYENTAGLFEVAEGGTILLDEIGELSAEAQVHLLRVLQEQTVQRIGETKARKVDVRVIAATNRDLDEEIRLGQFREDLYYRLSVFPVRLPPLRERVADIPLLIDHFLQSAGERFGKKNSGITPETADMLRHYQWPGNVRELENEIYRAVALADDEEMLQPHHFSPRITRENSLVKDLDADEAGYSEAVNRFRRQYVEHILRECDGNRSETAKRLKMHRPNLIALLKKLNLT